MRGQGDPADDVVVLARSGLEGRVLRVLVTGLLLFFTGLPWGDATDRTFAPMVVGVLWAFCWAMSTARYEVRSGALIGIGVLRVFALDPLVIDRVEADDGPLLITTDGRRWRLIVFSDVSTHGDSLPWLARRTRRTVAAIQTWRDQRPQPLRDVAGGAANDLRWATFGMALLLATVAPAISWTAWAVFR